MCHNTPGVGKDAAYCYILHHGDDDLGLLEINQGFGYTDDPSPSK